MSLEDMEYKLLKETAKRYGMEFNGNLSREKLVAGIREAMMNIDEELDSALENVVEDNTTRVEEPKTIVSLQPEKKKFGRGRGVNIQACPYCGHTHVPNQFTICQNNDCKKSLI